MPADSCLGTLVQKHVLIGVQPRSPSGVEEEDLLALPEIALPNEVQEAGGGLPGVHRIQEDPLHTREDPHRLGHLFGGDGVARAHIIVEDLQLTLDQAGGVMQELSGLGDQPADEPD